MVRMKPGVVDTSKPVYRLYGEVGVVSGGDAVVGTVQSVCPNSVSTSGTGVVRGSPVSTSGAGVENVEVVVSGSGVAVVFSPNGHVHQEPLVVVSGSVTGVDAVVLSGSVYAVPFSCGVAAVENSPMPVVPAYGVDSGKTPGVVSPLGHAQNRRTS